MERYLVAILVSQGEVGSDVSDLCSGRRRGVCGSQQRNQNSGEQHCGKKLFHDQSPLEVQTVHCGHAGVPSFSHEAWMRRACRMARSRIRAIGICPKMGNRGAECLPSLRNLEPGNKVNEYSLGRSPVASQTRARSSAG